MRYSCFHNCNGVNGFALDLYSDSRAVDISMFGSEALRMNKGTYLDRIKTVTTGLRLLLQGYLLSHNPSQEGLTQGLTLTWRIEKRGAMRRGVS